MSGECEMVLRITARTARDLLVMDLPELPFVFGCRFCDYYHEVPFNVRFHERLNHKRFKTALSKKKTLKARSSLKKTARKRVRGNEWMKKSARSHRYLDSGNCVPQEKNFKDLRTKCHDDGNASPSLDSKAKSPPLPRGERSRSDSWSDEVS